MTTTPTREELLNLCDEILAKPYGWSPDTVSNLASALKDALASGLCGGVPAVTLQQIDEVLRKWFCGSIKATRYRAADAILALLSTCSTPAAVLTLTRDEKIKLNTIVHYVDRGGECSKQMVRDVVAIIDRLVGAPPVASPPNPLEDNYLAMCKLIIELRDKPKFQSAKVWDDTTWAIDMVSRDQVAALKSLSEIAKSDLVRLARPPAPIGNGTTVGVQPVAHISSTASQAPPVGAPQGAQSTAPTSNSTAEGTRRDAPELIMAAIDFMALCGESGFFRDTNGQSPQNSSQWDRLDRAIQRTDVAAQVVASPKPPMREQIARWYFDEHYGYSLSDSFRTSAFNSGQHNDADRISFEMADAILALWHPAPQGEEKKP